MGGFRAIIRSQRGEGTVDYLIMTAMVVGIVFPLVIKYFGEPIMNSLNGQRSTLVQFVGQTPKRPVPNLWFAQERPAKVDNVTNVNDPRQVPIKEVDDPTELNDPTRTDPTQLNQPKTQTVGNLKDVKGNDVSDLPAVRTGGGGGSGGGGSGVGAGSGNLTADLTGSSGDSGKSGAAGESGKLGGYKSGSGADGDSGEGGESGRGRRDRKGGASGKDGGESEEAAAESKRKDNLSVQQIEQQERTRNKAFDWWMLMKILIVFAIVILLGMIALSNLKKR